MKIDIDDLTNLNDYVAMLPKYRQDVVAHCNMLVAAKDAIAYYSGNSPAPPALEQLQSVWYHSLDVGSPNYEVYDTDQFLAELWACWMVYSRKYVRLLASLDRRKLPRIRAIADLGCGAGHSTAYLKRWMPKAEVHGTNLRNTTQHKIATAMGRKHGFAVRAKVEVDTDLVFASEYFEHFEKPATHLIEVLERAYPKVLVLANSFSSRSVGHFDVYRVDDQPVHRTDMARRFNTELRLAGFRKLDTGFWNNRPAVWVR